MEDYVENKDKRQIFLKPKKCKKHWRIYIKIRLSLSKKKSDILKNALVNVKKGKRLSEKELKKIAKMQNLS